jgi:tRNA A-37 threonylcarbamoyl transferase component Bud32
MEEYHLKELKFITRGGEADIYDLGNGRILRVLRKNLGKKFEAEKLLFPIFAEHHINVPAIYDYIEVDGKPAQVMQKISGSTMAEQIQRHPLKLVKEIRELARMHKRLLEIQTDCELISIDQIFHYFIAQPPAADKKLTNFASKILGELPINKYICHGDFHPGNILIQNNTPFIIDWSNAYRSDFLSDIAHTYLLLTHIPKIPGQKHILYLINSCAGSIMAKVYRKEIRRLKEFSLSDFSKWTVVMSLLRCYYGMESEKPARIRYLNRCYELNERQTDPSEWYKYL